MDDERLQRRKRGEIIIGTPCAIGIKQADGCVRAIRCNYDGYIAGVGVILAGWYTAPAKIEALLVLGDLLQLAEELDTCVAYHRDRHEPMLRHGGSSASMNTSALPRLKWVWTTCTSTMTASGWSMGCTTCRSG